MGRFRVESEAPQLYEGILDTGHAVCYNWDTAKGAGRNVASSDMKDDTIAQLGVLCAMFETFASRVREETNEELVTHDHVRVIKHFAHLRRAMENLKTTRKALEDIEERLSREQIPDVMREHNVKTITIESVGRVTVAYRFGCSMLDKDMGLNWLRENGHGGLIIETVNSSTLGAFARDLLAEGQELPQDIFKTSTSPYTSITSVK